jgi:hypothetical protein
MERLGPLKIPLNQVFYDLLCPERSIGNQSEPVSLLCICRLAWSQVLIYLTRWVRLRLRCALWRQWKTTRRRREALLQLRVRPQLATNTAGSGRGPWYLARAKALSVGLSNAYFRSLGLPSLFENC